MRTLSLIGQENSATVHVFAEMERTSADYGIRILGDERFVGDQGDFRSILPRALDRSDDQFFIFAYPPSLSPGRNIEHPTSVVIVRNGKKQFLRL